MFFSDNVNVISSCSGCGSCGSYITDVRNNGQINYPSNYPSNANCNWLLLAPQGHRLGLRFEYFETSRFDYLIIYDGSTSNFTRIGAFSGYRRPSDILSSTESLYLEFKPDSSGEQNGFRIEYRKYKGITKLQY